MGRVDYQARGVLFLSAEARFANLLQLPEGANIGAAISDAMRAIERENDELKDMLAVMEKLEMPINAKQRGFFYYKRPG